MNRRFIAPLVGVIGLFAIWEAYVRLFNVRKFILRAPSSALRHLWNFRADFGSAAWVTVQHAIIGLTLALILAVAIGAVLVSNRFLEQAAQPVLLLVQVVPWVAYVPSVVVWLNAGTAPAVYMVTVVCLPAFAFATIDGMRSVAPATLELMASVDASPTEVLFRVRLPSAAPTLFTAARFNIGLALAIAYYVEGANLSNEGIGSIGRRAAALNLADPLWASVFTMAILGVAGLLGLSLLERWLLHWHAAQRAHPG